MKTKNRASEINRPLKSGIAALSLAIVTACGGGGGGGGVSSPQEPVGSGSVSGTASKGIVSAGLVNAYTLVNGVLSATAIASTTTNANGEYTFTLPTNYQGEPLVIKVEADSATRMKCDIAAGCGVGINFGDLYDVDEAEFSLSAVLPEVAGANRIANLTPLTTAASAIAVDTISSAVGTLTDFIVEQAIENANSQLAMRFGFTGDVTKIPVVDLTDAQSIAGTIGSDVAAVEYAAINAAIVSAVQADAAAPVTIEEAINSFVDDFVAGGISDNSSDPALTDLGDILTDAQAVLDEVEVALTDAGLTEALADLDSLSSDLASEQTMADAQEPSDVGDQGTPSETAGAAALAKVKALVEQVRDLGAFIQMAEVGENVPADTVQAALDNFQLQADAADLASSISVEQAVVAMGRATEAVTKVYELNFDFATGLPMEGSSIQAGSSIDFEGIQVNYALVGEAAEFNVAQDIFLAEFGTSVGVNMVFTLPEIFVSEECVGGELVEIGGMLFVANESCQFDANALLNISGSATAGNISVTVNEGSIHGQLAVAFTESAQEIDQQTVVESDSASFDLGALGFDLDVSVAESDSGQAGGPMRFDGTLSFSLANASLEESRSTTVIPGAGLFDTNYEDVYGLGLLELSVAGTFGNTESEFFASFSLAGDGVGVTFTEMFDESIDPFNINSVLEETEANFIGSTMMLAFTADLAGLTLPGDDASIEFSVSRTGLDDFSAAAEFIYPGHMLMLDVSAAALDTLNSGSATATVTNQDGVVINLDFDDSAVNEDDELTGSVVVDGELFAEVGMESGIIMVFYVDGSFESVY